MTAKKAAFTSSTRFFANFHIFHATKDNILRLICRHKHVISLEHYLHLLF